MGSETALLENIYKEAVEEIIYVEFPRVIEEARRKLETTDKWDDRSLKVKLPAQYCEAIRRAHGIESPMERKDLLEFVDAMFQEVAAYRNAPQVEFDKMYREAVIAKIGKESKQSISYKADPELIEEINNAYRDAHDKMSKIKMPNLKTTVPMIPIGIPVEA